MDLCNIMGYKSEALVESFLVVYFVYVEYKIC